MCHRHELLAHFPLLVDVLRTEALGIHLEEFHRLLRMAARHIVERRGGYVVGLALTDEGVVLEQIL
jgi:hypothetical protein